MTSSWHIVPFDGPEGLRRLEADWRQLLAVMPGHGPQHRHETHVAYFDHISRARGAYTCLALSDGRRLRAICPLERGHMTVFGRALDVLELPAQLWDLNRDLVCPPDEAQQHLLPAVLTWLRRQAGRPRWLVMDHVLEDSAAARCLSSLPRRAWCASRRGATAVFDTAPADAAGGFRAALPRKFKANLRSAARRRAATADVRFDCATAPGALLQRYRDFLAVETSGWKGAAGAHGAVGLNPAEKAFYDELIEIAAQGSRPGAAGRGVAEVHGLYVSEVCVASALCLTGAGERAVTKIAYDEAHARLAPGQALLEYLLDLSTRDPSIRRLNMVSDAGWLSAWRPQRLRKLRVAIGVGLWAGPLQVALLRAGEAAWRHLRVLAGRAVESEPVVPSRRRPVR